MRGSLGAAKTAHKHRVRKAAPITEIAWTERASVTRPGSEPDVKYRPAPTAARTMGSAYFRLPATLMTNLQPVVWNANVPTDGLA